MSKPKPNDEQEKDTANTPENENTASDTLYETPDAIGEPDTEQEDESTDTVDWASALAEQAAGEQTQADGLVSDDDWAAALAEQTEASLQPSQNKPSKASKHQAPAKPEDAAKPAPEVFPPLTGDSALSDSDIDLIMDIPVQLSVELGRTRLTIRNILQLGQGSVVELDGLAGEPMDIFVNGYLIAQGEVVVVDEKYGIRLTDIITPAERLRRLNGKR